MPRSPTMTIWASPNLSRTTGTIWVNAAGYVRATVSEVATALAALTGGG